MALLKRGIKRRRKDEKASFLGIIIPKKTSDYLSLFSIAKGVTKSSVIKSLLNDWVEKMKVEQAEEDLVYAIGKRSFEVWNNPVGKRMNYLAFKAQIKRELEMKYLNSYVNAILDFLDYEKDKSEGNTPA